MIVGIDISKMTFDACVANKRRVFTNDADGAANLLKWLNPSEKTHFCMEATGSYHLKLAEILYNSGHAVSVVNPYQVKKFKESKLIRQKTDKSDAFIIAEFGKVSDSIPFVPRSVPEKELRDLNKYVEDLKQDLNRWQNRLEQEHYNKSVKEGIDKKIQELETEISKLEDEIDALFKSSEEISEQYDRLTGIKGVGPRLATTIISEIPNIECFKSAKQFAAFVGVTPSHHTSGSSIRGQSHISRKGNRSVRKILYMAALVTKTHNEHFSKWVKALEARGKSPKSIIVAVMRKLLTIIFGMLKHKTSFNPRLAFSAQYQSS